MVDSHCLFLIVVVVACLARRGNAISCDSVKFASISLGYPVYYGECNQCYPTLLPDSATNGTFYVNCTANRMQFSWSSDCNSQNITRTLPFSTKKYTCNNCALVRLVTALFGPYTGNDYLLFNYTSPDCLKAQNAYWYLKKINETRYGYHIQDNCMDAADSYYHGHVICIPPAQTYSNKTNDGIRSMASPTMQISMGFVVALFSTFFT